MIESFNDWISMIVLLIIMTLTLVAVLRIFFRHRQQKLIEEEIEYYQEW